ncbi:MAG: hypothetical protein ACM3ZC_05380 [Bacteroidota bacterium]
MRPARLVAAIRTVDSFKRDAEIKFFSAARKRKCKRSTVSIMTAA